MSTPTDTLWEIESHTSAKHSILRRYLGAWFGIMGMTNPRIIYIDGFSGPGRYKGGEEGSPIIALKLALEHQQKSNIRGADFLFIEENLDRKIHLEKEVASLSIPSIFNVTVVHNQFEDTISSILSELDKHGTTLAPTFAFIDPFGFKGAPFSVVQKLLQNPKTEVFINIMADSINRFVEHPDPSITSNIVDLFGTNRVLEIMNSGSNRLHQLRQLYQDQLKQYATFVRYFEMRNEDNRVIYYLFFASNNRIGHLKMKQAFWKVDPASGYTFSDATNPLQPVLFKTDPSLNLSSLLATRFQGKNILVDEVKLFVEDSTAYTESHMKKALCILEGQKKLSVAQYKLDGTKRVKHSFPNGVIVTFPFTE